MYTQILKEILLTIDFEQQHIDEFLTYCQEQFVDNSTELKNVEKLRKEYRHNQPIWWYTYDCFLYSMLNKALRVMDADLIIKMGFFLRNLHQHIAALHAEQYGGQNSSNSFIVYRGQGLSPTDFDQLMATQGGLLSFNSFLSTSKDRNVAFDFAQRMMATSNLMGVLFVMKIDPAISATPFAKIRDVSAYETEEEILFSMHSVFRIGQVKQLNRNNRLSQVELSLTSDNDPQLLTLTKYMSEQITGSTGWLRLARLMLRLGDFNKAEELCKIMLKQTTNENKKAHLYGMLGIIKNKQGKYGEAIEFDGKALEIYQKTLPPNHPDLANSYSNIGSVYYKMGKYSKALSYYEKALEIKQKTLSPNHPDWLLLNNIGVVYYKIGEYPKARSYYKQALEIREKTLPSNHPDLATSHNNIGGVHSKMGEYLKALLYYEQALEIRKKTLPPNHPDLATSYNNVGGMHSKTGKYSKVLSYYEQALEIRKKTLPPSHPDLANSYSNIGSVYYKMGEYSKALSYYEQALEIQQKTLSPNQSDLATSYNNIGEVYSRMGEHSKAPLYYEKALEIQQKTLPPNHPDLLTLQKNIKIAKKKM